MILKRMGFVLTLISLFSANAAFSRDVNVKDFGAAPNDGRGDDERINQAIEACRPGDRLIFEKGVYDLWNTIKVNDKENIDVVGVGSLLMLHGFDRSKGRPTYTAIDLTSSKSVAIQGFTIDMDVSPNSAGEIVDVQESSFDVRLYDEFPLTEDIFVDRIMTFYPDGRPNGANLDMYGDFTVEKIDERILRIHLKKRKDVSKGELLCLYHKVYGGQAIHIGDSIDCALRDVTVQAFAGMGLVANDRTANLTVERYKVQRPQGSKRLTSTNADGSKFIFTGGLLTVKDSEYEGMGDDAINIHSSFGQVASIDREKSEIRVVRPHRNGLREISSRYVLPGDRIEIYDRKTFLPKGVSEVLQRTGDVLQLDGLPNDLSEDDLFNNISMTPRVRISGVTVRRNRARGFLLQSQDVIVENCKIFDPTGVGIFVTTDVNYWYESGPGKDIVIRNNTIVGANNHLIMEGAINVKCSHDSGGTDRPAGVHRNISIIGNTIRNTSGSGIFVCSTDGVEVFGNTIESCSANPKLPYGRYAVFLKNCKNTSVFDNTVINGIFDFGGRGCE